MFGTIRSAPSSSVSELLEQERPHSKLLKDDSLSIFETTLMKLKHGSRRCSTSELNSCPKPQDSMDFESVISGERNERRRMVEFGSSSESGDSLSIFETTLMKLKQGSRRCFTSELNSSPQSQDSMDFESTTTVSPVISGERNERKMVKFGSSSETDDSLSIFETTLMKLKQGSRRCLTSELNSTPKSQDSMDFESTTSTVSEDSCVNAQSKPDQVQEKRAGVSIQYLFSRYTSLHKKQNSISSDTDSSPSNGSGCSSDSGSNNTGSPSNISAISGDVM